MRILSHRICGTQYTSCNDAIQANNAGSIALCDGVGKDSFLPADEVAKYMVTHLYEGVLPVVTQTGIQNHVQLAHDLLQGMSNSSRRYSSTLVGAFPHGENVYTYSIGDSSILGVNPTQKTTILNQRHDLASIFVDVWRSATQKEERENVLENVYGLTRQFLEDWLGGGKLDSLFYLSEEEILDQSCLTRRVLYTVGGKVRHLATDQPVVDIRCWPKKQFRWIVLHSDGILLSPTRVGAILSVHGLSNDTLRRIVEASFKMGSLDDCSIVVAEF